MVTIILRLWSCWWVIRQSPISRSFQSSRTFKDKPLKSWGLPIHHRDAFRQIQIVCRRTNVEEWTKTPMFQKSWSQTMNKVRHIFELQKLTFLRKTLSKNILKTSSRRCHPMTVEKTNKCYLLIGSILFHVAPLQKFVRGDRIRPHPILLQHQVYCGQKVIWQRLKTYFLLFQKKIYVLA